MFFSFVGDSSGFVSTSSTQSKKTLTPSAKSNPSDKIIIATVGADKLSLSDFETSFAKNNGGPEKAAELKMEDRERYLDLLIRFKTKVYEARQQGLVRDSAIQEELKAYRASVASSYILEKEVIDPAVQELYNRKLWEVRVSHILFMCAATASPAETLAAYKKAMTALNEIPKNGFEATAAKYSEDRSVQTNKGDIGYFIPGRMIPEFEDACYRLKPGQMTPKPIRSRYGYHIVKLTDKIKNLGAGDVSHILRRHGLAAGDTVIARDSIQIIYEFLKNGMPFELAAMKFSQDPNTAARGGEVGTFDRAQIPNAELATALFATPVGQYSKPFEAPYGWHIFKMRRRAGIKPFEEQATDLRNLYQQYRYETDHQNLVKVLRGKYKTTLNDNVFADLMKSIDTAKSTTVAGWNDTLTTAMLNKTLFSIGGNKYPVQVFVRFLLETKSYEQVLLTTANIKPILDKFVDTKTLEVYALTRAEKYPEFVALMKEYEEGILLYRMEQDEVWKNVIVNDSLLRLYHETVKEKYTWPNRVNFAEIFVESDSEAYHITEQIYKGRSFGEAAAELTIRAGYKEKNGEWGLISAETNELSKTAYTQDTGKISLPLQYESKWSIVKTLLKDPARLKTFEEVKPEIASAYQDMMSKKIEDRWVEALKKKHNVSVFKERLVDAYGKKPK
jgi:peptidyl-prolyl cis-trans isomerase SurA